MSAQDDVTIGEIHRLCIRIEGKVDQQNDRLDALERDAIRLKTIWVGIVVVLGFGIDWLKHKLGIS